MPRVNKCKNGNFKESLLYFKEVIAARYYQFNNVCSIRFSEQVARKENDLIYHERILAVNELDEIKVYYNSDYESTTFRVVDMVKAISFKATDISIAGEDLFKELLPSSVVEIVSLYEETKAELRRNVINKCDRMDTELESYLISLKLDTLNLDQPGDMQRLPDELLSCYGEFHSQPSCVHNLLEKFHGISLFKLYLFVFRVDDKDFEG